MKWNPFQSKRGRIIAAFAFAVLAPAGYLASYPITYRVVVGPDPVETEEFQLMCGFDPLETVKGRNARRMEQHFRPVVWLIDNTPCRTPILLVAAIVNTDEQIEDDRRGRMIRIALKRYFSSPTPPAVTNNP